MTWAPSLKYLSLMRRVARARRADDDRFAGVLAMTGASGAESLELITPDWSAPAGVRATVSTRRGGVSVAPWDSLNIGVHVGDDPAAVLENRVRIRREADLP